MTGRMIKKRKIDMIYYGDKKISLKYIMVHIGKTSTARIKPLNRSIKLT
jgi:hypothetical protein